jgi:hypothetical protein
VDLSHPTTLLLPAGIAALVGWRLYSRVRRMVGRQRLSKVRPWVTLCLFPPLLVLLVAGSWSHPSAALGLVGGTMLGIALGFFGLRLTRFEQTPVGLFYTPSAHLGIALSLLLFARIGYRVAQMYVVPGAMQGGSAAFARSPLTMLIFGTLAGYYVCYAAGLLRWRRRVRRAGRPAVPDSQRV